MLRPIDIITRSDRVTGELSDPEDATNRGLWHRGAHGFLLTPGGLVLIQKRSLDQPQYPGLVDIGVGGFVDHGETPEEALIREVKEETGLEVRQDQLLFLGTSKHIRHWKRNGRPKLSRAILYSYAVRLDSDRNAVTPEKGEVAWIGFVPLRTALWLLHRGSLPRLGTLLPMRAYYRRCFKQIARFIH
ncbi:MAG TPA: NUDIX domain-containing protein [Candidatus Saccharimonadales bacterium]|nr:NUDIX domain-containing protein [Candidatus Saccharimonadales bacterium]